MASYLIDDVFTAELAELAENAENAEN